MLQYYIFCWDSVCTDGDDDIDDYDKYQFIHSFVSLLQQMSKRICVTIIQTYIAIMLTNMYV